MKTEESLTSSIEFKTKKIVKSVLFPLHFKKFMI